MEIIVMKRITLGQIKKWMVIAAVLFALTSPVIRHAALIAESNYALDTATGLDRINAQTADGYSYNQIKAGVGGFIAAGWRYGH